MVASPFNHQKPQSLYPALTKLSYWHPLDYITAKLPLNNSEKNRVLRTLSTVTQIWVVTSLWPNTEPWQHLLWQVPYMGRCTQIRAWNPHPPPSYCLDFRGRFLPFASIELLTWIFMELGNQIRKYKWQLNWFQFSSKILIKVSPWLP